MPNDKPPVTQAIVKQQFTALRTFLERKDVKDRINSVIAKHVTIDRLYAVAYTAFTRTPALWECSIESIARALQEAGQLGLEPDGALGQAWMVPFYNKKIGRKEAKLLIGWRGFVTLARRSGEVSAIWTEIHYENDPFDIECGTERRLTHKPNFKDRGEPVGAYSIVRYKDGFCDFEYMTAEEIEQVKKSSQSKDLADSPWKTHELEMWRKSPLRRHAKRMPLAADYYALMRAAVLDEYAEAGVDQEPEVELTLTPPDDPETKHWCEQAMKELGYTEAQQLMQLGQYTGKLDDLAAQLREKVSELRSKKAKTPVQKPGPISADQPPESGVREPGDETDALPFGEGATEFEK